MVKYALTLGVVMVMTLGACKSGGSRRADSGVMLMDGGPGSDAPATPDSGPRTDSGGGGGCTFGTTGGLMGACFPRCSAATLTAVMMCGASASCQQMAVDADTTAPITITIEGMPLTLDCSTCFAVQINTCIAEACPTEFQSLVACERAMMGACTAESTALNGCLTPQMTAVQGCVNMRAGMCFPGA